MFYSAKLLAIRLHDYKFRNPNKPIGGHFVFLEDAEDIVNEYGTVYQYRDYKTPNNFSVTVRAIPSVAVLDLDLFYELQHFLQFEIKMLYAYGRSQQEDVLLGFADLLVLPMTFVSSPVSLLPTFRYQEKIWVSDISYSESKLFFVESFVPTLWITFLAIFILCCLLHLCVNKILGKYRDSQADPFNIVTLIMDQGVEADPSIWSHKIILFSLAVLLIVFFGGFGAFLSSLLTIKKVALPFSDLIGILTQNEYTLCLQFGSVSYAIAEYEKKINKEFKVNINKEDCPYHFRFRPVNMLTTVGDEGCAIGKVAIVTGGTGQEFQKFAKRCKLSPMPGNYLPLYTAFLLYPGFKHRTAVNRMLLLFRTTGVIRNDVLRLQNTHKVNNAMEFGKHVNEPELKPVTFYQIHLILAMFLVGCILASIILVIEILHKRDSFKRCFHH